MKCSQSALDAARELGGGFLADKLCFRLFFGLAWKNLVNVCVSLTGIYFNRHVLRVRLLVRAPVLVPAPDSPGRRS